MHYNQGHTFVSSGPCPLQGLQELDVLRYYFISAGIKYAIEIMVEAAAVNTIKVNCLESCHSSREDIFLDRNGHWDNCKFGAFL